MLEFVWWGQMRPSPVDLEPLAGSHAPHGELVAIRLNGCVSGPTTGLPTHPRWLDNAYFDTLNLSRRHHLHCEHARKSRHER